MMTFTAQQVAQLVGGEIIGNAKSQINDVCAIEDGREGCISFLYDARYLPYLDSTKASVVLLSRKLEYKGTTSATLILVDNAREAVAQLLRMVSEVLNPRKHGIEQPCFIAEGVGYEQENTYIGAFAYIGKNVRIGKNVQIYPQCYVGEDCVIGDNTILYSGVKLYHHCIIGNNCILHGGAVIGADGFGFEPDAEGVNQKIPQIGNVIIEDDVEIGANTCIDRAMTGSTIVHRNAKIDNLVQIAHSDEIGESTFLCAQVGIAGSTKVGAHCTLTGQVGVTGHIQIADNCVFGAQSGVSGTVKKAGIYMGTPAFDAAQWKRAAVGFRNLPEMQKILYELQKKQQ